ncbi:MAG: hypothetical protein M1825_002013 [Sarcosagium campestre]|nr:MAG: hypothetical protein M1825_002013 [Sarcosagium campestre]
MALPPQTLHIKRKLDEDPVEALYLQVDQRQKKQRRFTDFVYNLATPRDGMHSHFANILHRDVRSSSSSLQADLKPFKGGHDNKIGLAQSRLNDSKAKVTSLKSTGPSGSGPPSPSKAADVSRPAASAKQPRQFHLCRSTSSLSTFSHSRSAIGKTKKPRRQHDDVAVFVERTKSSHPIGRPKNKKSLKHRPDANVVVAAISNGTSATTSEDTEMVDHPVPPVNAIAASTGAKTSAKAAHSKTIRQDGSLSKSEENSMFLAMQQHQQAMRELDGSSSTLKPPKTTTSTTSISPPSTSLVSKQVRIRPNPNAQRYKDRHPDPNSLPAASEEAGLQDIPMDTSCTTPIDEQHMPDEEMGLNDEDDDEVDYVLDTYIRVPVAASSSSPESAVTTSATTTTADGTSLIHPLRTKDGPHPQSFGLLVITDDSKDLWDTYVANPDDSAEEEDYNSDEDDSNAEDFYTNEYPDEDPLAHSLSSSSSQGSLSNMHHQDIGYDRSHRRHRNLDNDEDDDNDDKGNPDGKGGDEQCWSDSEDLGHRPWKKAFWEK